MEADEHWHHDLRGWAEGPCSDSSCYISQVDAEMLVLVVAICPARPGIWPFMHAVSCTRQTILQQGMQAHRGDVYIGMVPGSLL